MNKPIQPFTKEYLEKGKKLPPDKILEFIENYKRVVYKIPKKIEPSLCAAFKQKAQIEGIPY